MLRRIVQELYFSIKFGTTDEQKICFFLTNVPKSHWIENNDECSNLIEERTDSIYLISLNVFRIYVIYSFLAFMSSFVFMVVERKLFRQTNRKTLEN